MRKLIAYGLWFIDKKIFLAKLLIFFLLFTIYYIPSTIYATGATLSLSPASGTFNKGCTFSLTVNLDTGGASTDGTDAILFYDPTRLTATKITSGTIYPDYPGNNIDTQQGKITVSGLSSVTSAYSGSGVLATIDFQVAPNAPAGVTQVKFDFDPTDKAKTTDSNVVERGTISDILNQVVDGSFTIGSGACGSSKYGVGGPESSSSSTVKPMPPVKTLPQSADFNTTLILGVGGSLLVILGILGLAIL